MFKKSAVRLDISFSIREFCCMSKCKAVFLDRDGVINHDPGDYTMHVSEFQILPTVLETLKYWNDKGYKLILITNQGGIAKGLYGHKDVDEIHDYFLRECAKADVVIDDIFYSPHHDDYSRSMTRKPGSLMLERAIHRYNIDPSQSYMIGDKQRDLDAGDKVGVQGILMVPNSPLSEVKDFLA